MNVYGSSSLLASRESAMPIKPLRALGNLITTVTSMEFNHDSQLMAIASDVKKDQLRLVRLSSWI